MGVVLYCLDRRSILEKPERQWRAEGNNITLARLAEHPDRNREGRWFAAKVRCLKSMPL
jgi:hypothetical protein